MKLFFTMFIICSVIVIGCVLENKIDPLCVKCGSELYRTKSIENGNNAIYEYQCDNEHKAFLIRKNGKTEIIE
jgi:hypothetical protein